ncbi:Nucleotide-binding universal stress protein, UspA family [Amycolatopsis sacchari]|uniref:Nucleotide-binding universal stress protein, UspA family n=1 Tax=Amycolatopsis sacchari TaxID=115433 RepID=A0A1I3KW29_9PSEU|nr:universal stress protein [Amycolatopsis sacchari]SFI76538.1 Nucleotide-binding universal stress protein, UspA family [Amycolatopsis sacchari]
MGETAAQRAILVGVGGSASASRAVARAAREGARRHVPVHLFHTCDLPSLGPHITAGSRHGLTETPVEQGHHRLHLAKVQAREAAARTRVETELKVGPPTGELVAASAHALMVALGSRGFGGFRGMLMGPVSSSVAVHAHGPVVRGGEPHARGAVVVGVDGFQPAEAAVAFVADRHRLGGRGPGRAAAAGRRRLTSALS